MPVYAYGCKDCGHAFDIRQSFSDAALTECPECGGTLRKKFNTVGVVFKGSGFYRTDSRSDSGKPGSGTDGAKPDTKAAAGSSDAAPKNGATAGKDTSSAAAPSKATATTPA